MSNPRHESQPRPAPTGRLYYLLKHAQMRLADLTAPALAPFGINGRECAMLIAIDERAPQSQQDVADRMNLDRTTMVTLIDDLERKGLVQRRPQPGDRRKNVVALTEVGRTTLAGATRAVAEAERRFLGPLSEDEAANFRAALRAAAFPASPEAAPHEPASPEPAAHEAAPHEPASPEPAAHEAAPHEPASPEPAAHEAAPHEPASPEPAAHEAAPHER